MIKKREQSLENTSTFDLFKFRYHLFFKNNEFQTMPILKHKHLMNCLGQNCCLVVNVPMLARETQLFKWLYLNIMYIL